jgi:TP901 family phage tail tape measure protein
LAGINLGTIYARLTADDELSAVLARASTNLDTFAKKADRMGSRLQAAGGQLTTAVTVPIVAMGAAIIKTGADFDRGMNLVNAVLEATPPQMEILRKKAIEMGRDTVFSASDAAEALAELAKAGLDVDETMGAVSPVMQLAAASGLSMGEAASISARAMRAFGLETSDLTHLNDILAKGVNDSTLELTDIATAFKYVGPVATGFGMTVAQTVAALAEMRDAGLGASMAGRALREGLERLANPVKSVRDVMGELGIESFMSGGSLMNLSQVIGLLESKSLSVPQSLKLFGDAAGPGMYALVHRGKEALDELTLSFDGASGTAQKMADAMMSGLPGALEQLRGSVETALIALKDAFEPTLIRVIQTAERAADFVTNRLVPAFTSLPVGVQQGVLAFIAMLAALGPVLVGLGTFIRVVGFAAEGLQVLITYLGPVVRLWGLLGAAFAAVSWPVVAIVAFVSAVGAAGVAVLKFTGLWDPLMGMLSDVMRIAKNLVILGFEEMKTVLEDVAHVITGMFKDAWVEMRSMLAGILGVTEAQVIPALKGIGLAVLSSIPGLREMISAIAWLKNNVPGASRGLKGAADASDALVKAARERGAPPLPPGFGSAAFPTGLGMGLGSIGSETKWTLPTAPRGGSGGGGGKVDSAWKDFLDEISGRSAVTEAQKWMRGLEAIGGLTKMTAETQDRLNNVLGDALTAYAALGVRAPVDMAKVWLATLPTPKVITGLGELAEHVLDVKKSIAVPFESFLPVTSGLGNLAGAGATGVMAGAGLKKMPTFLQDAFGSAGDFGSNLSKTIMSAVTGGGSVVNAVSGMLGGSLMSGVVGRFSKTFASTFLGGTLSAILPGLGALVGPLMEKITSLFNKPEWKKILSGVGRDWGVDISEGLAKSIETDAKRLNSRFAATLLHIADIVKEGGGVEKFGLEKTIAKTRDLFVEVGQKAITTKEAATAMGSIFPQIAEVIVKSNRIASASFVELIALNKQFGLDTQEILTFVTSQAGRAADGIVAMLGPLTAQKELTAESAAEFERMGIVALGTFNAAITAGVDWLTAVQTIGPALDALLAIQTNLGITTENAALSQLHHYRELVSANETLVVSAGALNQTLLALSNIGGLTVETLAAMEAQGLATFDRLTAAGFSQNESLMMMKGFLENIILAHQQLGVPIDENTQRLINMATEQGILSEQSLSTNDILMQGFAALIEAVGGQLPEAFQKMRDAAVLASTDITTAVNGIPRDVPVYVHLDDGTSPAATAEGAWRGAMVMASRLQHLAGGGLVAFQPRGTDTVPAMLTPGEGVVSVRGMDALGADGLASLNNGAGLGGTTVRNSFVINNPQMDSDDRVEQLADAIARRIYNGGKTRTSWDRALKGLGR